MELSNNAILLVKKALNFSSTSPSISQIINKPNKPNAIRGFDKDNPMAVLDRLSKK